MKKAQIFVGIIALLLTSCKDNNSSSILPSTIKMNLNCSTNDLVLEDTDFSKTNLNVELIENGNIIDSSKVVLETSNDNIEIEGNEIIAKKVGKSTITASYEDIVKTIDFEIFEKKTYTSVFDESVINYYGRIDKVEDEDGAYVRIDNTSSGFECNFLGTSLSISTEIEGYGFGAIRAIVDGNKQSISVSAGNKVLAIAANLENKVHRVKVIKMTEQSVQRIKLKGIRIKGTLLNKNDKPERKFEFYGDSITCGYGANSIKNEVTNDTDGSNTYATMLGNHYNAEVSCVSHSGISVAFRRDSGNYLMKEVFDYISIFNQKKYDYSKYQADIVFINLGTNDSAYADRYNEDEMTSKYLELLTSIREKQPNSYIFCMYGMMGKYLTVEEDIKRAVAEFKRTIDTNICYNTIEGNIFGSNGHPDEKGHKKAYEQIVEIIDSKNILQ